MYRIGIIGMGGIARAHLGAYAALGEHVQVTACCDRLLERATGATQGVLMNLGELAGVALHACAYTDYPALIADANVDVDPPYKRFLSSTAMISRNAI